LRRPRHFLLLGFWLYEQALLPLDRQAPVIPGQVSRPLQASWRLCQPAGADANAGMPGKAVNDGFTGSLPPLQSQSA
jgi:hypothetical protein